MAILYSIDKESKIVLCESEQELIFSCDETISSASEFLEIVSDQKIRFPERYEKMSSSLSISRKNLFLSLPKFVIRKYFEDLKSTVDQVFSEGKNTSYLNYYKTSRDFIDSLCQPNFNSVKVNNLASRQKFEPQKEAVSAFVTSKSRTRYSMSGTVTGRLTVSSGPNILTSPAEIRKCLVSSKPGGRILQIDLVSAEPQFAVFVSGRNPPVDVYSHLSKSVFKGSLSRSQVKIATLCALYGQSARKLSSIIDGSMSSVEVIDKVKNYFDFRNLKKMLVNSYRSGDFRNHLNRPLKTDREELLISHYLQSSVAEASLIMFSDFCNRNSGVSPIYLIHDALIVDADEEFVRDKKDGDIIQLKYQNWDFYASISFLDGG